MATRHRRHSTADRRSQPRNRWHGTFKFRIYGETGPLGNTPLLTGSMALKSDHRVLPAATSTGSAPRRTEGEGTFALL